jgi:O-antigen/teichoic acid export membrane protein
MASQQKKILVNTSYNLLGKLLPLAVAIIAIPLLVQKMGTTRFGILTLTWAVIGYFNLFDLGVGRATTRFVAEYLALKQTEDLPQLIWSSLFLLFSFGVLAGLVGWSLSPWLVERVLNIEPSLQEETRQSLCILLACLPFVFATAGMAGVLQAQQRFGVLNTIQVPLGLVNFLGPLPILAYTVSLVPVVASLALARLLVCGILFTLIRRALPGMNRPCWPKAKNIKKLLSFGGWLTVSNIIGPLMVYLDRFLIGSWLTMSAVAYYVTPYELVTRLWIIPASLLPVLFPVFSAYALERKDKLRVLHDRVVKFLFLILAPAIITIIVMAQPILELWLGREFATLSTPVLQVLALGVLINSMAQVPFGAIQAAGRPDLTAQLHLAEFPVYLLCLWLLIKPMGIIGVALAWTIRISLDTSLLFWLARRLFPKPTRLPAAQNKSFFYFGLIGFMAAVSALAQLPSLAGKIIFLPIIIMLFCIWGWRCTLDNAEREEAIVLLGRFRRLFLWQGDIHG